MQEFGTLRQPLLGELAISWREREKEEKKMPFIVANYVRAAHALRSDQFSFTFKLILSVYLQSPQGGI